MTIQSRPSGNDNLLVWRDFRPAMYPAFDIIDGVGFGLHPERNLLNHAGR
jgi:hypothetical protein